MPSRSAKTNGSTVTGIPTEVVWRPQTGPQKALIDCPVYEIFYGGARGGGKTDGVLGKMALKAQAHGPHFNAVFFRRELPQLDDAIERSVEIFRPLGAKYNETKKSWRFPWGGRLRFRPLESVGDAEKYQGQNLTDANIEEAGNFADSAPIMRLHGALRSAHGVPVQMHLTGNPGGPGQHWLKQRYIDPHPMGFQIIRESIKVQGSQEVIRSRVFIPAKVWDNKVLLANDPGYIAGLHMVGSDQLVNAWLNGDWDAIVGAYFDCWSTWRANNGVIRPCAIPDHWTRFRAFDWGSAAPFSVGWWAVATDDHEHPDGYVIPKNAMIRYREWYGASGPNVGLKLTAEQVASGIRERETETIHYGVADPSIFAQDGGPSIAERMLRSAKITWRPADNKRVSEKGKLGGWDQLRQRFLGEDGKPMIYCFSTCTDSIRTIPALQHDEDRPEDVDTDGEDHAGDEWRYACMSRPYIRKAPELTKPKWPIERTFNELRDSITRQRADE